MSIYNRHSKKNEHGSSGLELLKTVSLFVLLLAVQPVLFLFSATTLAAARPAASDPPESLARAGVSVVRLLASYHDASTHPQSTLFCTGLGVLVANWSDDKPENNTFILTDGSLLNTQPGTACVPGSHPKAELDTVQIYFNTLYNSQSMIKLSLANKAFQVTCSDPKNCANGPALLSFHASSQLPYADLSQEIVSVNALGIQLTDAGDQTAVPPQPATNVQPAQADTQLEQFLTPNQVVVSNGNFHGEAGTPLVDPHGLLTGIHLSNGEDFAGSGVMTFLKQLPLAEHPVTAVQQNWRIGVVKYYEAPVDMSGAKQAFHNAAVADPQFLAAADFETRAGSNITGNGGKTPVSTPDATHEANTPLVNLPGFLTNQVHFGPISFPFWVLIVGAIILILVVIAIISLLITSLRRRQEFAVAEKKAAVEAQRIAALEAGSTPVQAPDWLQQPTLPMQQSPVLPNPGQQVKRSGMLSTPDLHCPRCGELVPMDANYCSNCRLMLSPTESGLHLRVQALNAAPKPIVLPPSSPAPVGQPALSSQPTQTSQLAAVRPNSIVEHPTIEISQADVPGNNAQNTDVTAPYTQLQGRRLGFVVGTNSNPGIKRKYKPNEDSLFAAQGPRSANAAQQGSFGLFVVADGMGGHANGQDASRRAIQNLIDYMLPRLMRSADASPEELQTLLQEGVQQANQAVHRNNMELRADMGTTMTATLVVDATAYVCNVGDSRTYLYRQGEGLRKVTNDHSVVASLVEAGIIKPDDIYTHPKRNQIYRSLGEKANVEVDSFQVTLQPGDKMLLCSDGLWDMVRDPKIEDVIKAPALDPGQTASALIDAALEGGGEDNVSVIVISATESAQNGITTDFRLIAKPDTVQVPPM